MRAKNSKKDGGCTSGFVQVPNSVRLDPRVTPMMLAVYISLLSYRRSADRCWPTIRQISRDVGIATRTVMRSIRNLEEAGFIRIARRQFDDGGVASNMYYFLDQDKSDKDKREVLFVVGSSRGEPYEVEA